MQFEKLHIRLLILLMMPANPLNLSVCAFCLKFGLMLDLGTLSSQKNPINSSDVDLKL